MVQNECSRSAVQCSLGTVKKMLDIDHSTRKGRGKFPLSSLSRHLFRRLGSTQHPAGVETLFEIASFQQYQPQKCGFRRASYRMMVNPTKRLTGHNPAITCHATKKKSEYDLVNCEVGLSFEAKSECCCSSSLQDRVCTDLGF